MIKKALLQVLLLLLCSLVVIACSRQTPSEERDNEAKDSDGPIVIGAVWPHDSFWRNMGKGIDMAVNEINAKGGLLGRKLEIVKADDEASVNKGLVIAQNFSNNLDMVAVIGHIHSYVSLAAANTYEFNGIVMLSPASTATILTKRDHKRIFRMMPNNSQLGKQIAKYIKTKGYQRVIVYYPRGDYGRDLANYFEQHANKLGLHVVDRRSYLEDVTDHRDDLEDWGQLYRFDVILLPGSLPEVAHIIKQIRELGMTQPIIGGDAMDTQELAKQTGTAGEGVIIITPFHFKKLHAKILKFINDYRKKHKQDPDAAAAYGYDAVMLLAHAIQEAKSSAPNKIAKYLHSGHTWQGVAGKYSYDKHGDIVVDRLFTKIIKDGKLVPFDNQAVDNIKSAKPRKK